MLIRQVLFSLSFFLVLMVPVVAGAQGLVPCGSPGQDACTTDDVVEFVARIIEFLIFMLGTMAVIVLVYAGLRMVVSAGNEAEWTKAKSLFSNVVIGIIIILAAWLIVDTVMRALTGEGLNYWSNFSR